MRNFFLFLFVKEPETEVGLTEIRDHVSTGILSETVELKPWSSAAAVPAAVSSTTDHVLTLNLSQKIKKKYLDDINAAIAKTHNQKWWDRWLFQDRG